MLDGAMSMGDPGLAQVTWRSPSVIFMAAMEEAITRRTQKIHGKIFDEGELNLAARAAALLVPNTHENARRMPGVGKRPEWLR